MDEWKCGVASWAGMLGSDSSSCYSFPPFDLSAAPFHPLLLLLLLLLLLPVHVHGGW